MKYQKTNSNTYVISLAPGEEILEKIQVLLEEEKINNAYFLGIGALKEAELAHFRVENKKYSSKIFTEPLELANMTGNAFLHQGKPLIHAHVTLANDEFMTIAGHLVKGIISAACEIILIKMDSQIEKKHSPEIGLNILTFN